MTQNIGDGWISNLDELKKLEGFAGDAAFRLEWCKVQYDVKVRLARYILEQTGISIDPQLHVRCSGQVESMSTKDST